MSYDVDSKWSQPIYDDERCSVKKVFLECSQNSQENTCARVSSLIKLQAIFFYRTPPVAASVKPMFPFYTLWKYF